MFNTPEQVQAARWWLRKKTSDQLHRMQFAGKFAYEAEMIVTRILIQREDGWEVEPRRVGR